VLVRYVYISGSVAVRPDRVDGGAGSHPSLSSKARDLVNWEVHRVQQRRACETLGAMNRYSCSSRDCRIVLKKVTDNK
jgi:hypothetical protein